MSNRTSKGSVNVQQQKAPRKPGFYGDEEESEPSIYFNNQSVFRPSEKDMMTSASPSQLSAAFSSNLYQPQQSGMNSLGLHQRGITSAPFQRNQPGHVTPTSMGQGGFPMGLQQQQASPNSMPFPIGLQQQQQQASPNRNLFQRGLLPHMQTTNPAALSSQLKQRSNQINLSNPISSAIMSSQANSGTNSNLTGNLPPYSRTQNLDGGMPIDTPDWGKPQLYKQELFSSQGLDLDRGMPLDTGDWKHPAHYNKGSRLGDANAEALRSGTKGQQPWQLAVGSPNRGALSMVPIPNSNKKEGMPTNHQDTFINPFNYENQPSLDFSESQFPTLGNRSAPPNPVPTPRNYGMVSKPTQEPAPEFQIQPEEFPALPGAQIVSSRKDIERMLSSLKKFHLKDPPTSTANDTSRKTPTTSPSLGSYEQALSRDGAKFPGDKASGSTRRGIQTLPDGTVTNIPGGMVTDQFGMVGLLTFIRAAETDPNLVALAPGIDLTTLGLSLNAPENLYTTFQSPWADTPCRPQDIVFTDFHVPQEYLTNIFIREKLAPIKLNRYGDDLLFFLFYMNGGDVLQLAAACELYNRDWRYHKEERVWITRVPGLEPQMKTNTFEKGTYYFFDAQNWRKVAKEFRLEYDKLEERPHLPPAWGHQASQPPVMAH